MKFMPAYGAFNAANLPNSSLATRIFREVEKSYIPLEATLELTQDCNFRCTHCYNFDRTESKRPLQNFNSQSGSELQNKDVSTPQGKSLEYSEILSLVDELESLGCLNMTLTGGEVLLWPRLLELIKNIRQRHMGVYLKTNGSLLSPQRVKQLLEARVMGLEVSLYGENPKTHDEFARTPGSYPKIWEGLQNCLQQKLPVKIQFVITSYNAHEVEAFIRKASEYGLDYSFNPQMSARYDGSRTSLDHRLSASQLKTLYAGPLRSEIPPPDFNPKASVQCGCARGICGIGYEGTVYPCIGAPLPAGNIRTQSFSDIWKNAPLFQKIRGLTLDDFEQCSPCAYRPYCRRSSGLVYTNTGNYLGNEDWTCMEAKTLQEVWTQSTPDFPSTLDTHSSTLMPRAQDN